MPDKIIFVNGLLFPGIYPGGEGYWLGANSAFVTGAQAYLGGEHTAYFADIKHQAFSSAADRIQAGWLYASAHQEILTERFQKATDQFHFITHSMGAAFAEGMVNWLQDKEYHIGTVIHFNAFQAADIEVKRKANQKGYVIDYQNTNDPMINNPVYASPGDIKNTDVKIRLKSNKVIFRRHRDPIDAGHSWKILLQSA